MAEVDMANPLPDIHQAPVHPDAQATVTDFLDYTEFFPSDLERSLQLIGKLDTTYLETTDLVHNLTTTYGKLPNITSKDRPDPIALRKQISAALSRATHCRESAHAEACRLHDVAERHLNRLTSIKRKLQALPKPPSRDPTPVPQAISPVNARTRRLQEEKERQERAPRLKLTVDGDKKGLKRKREKRVITPGGVLPPPEPDVSSEEYSSDSSEEDGRSATADGVSAVGDDVPLQINRTGKSGRIKVPKVPRLDRLKIPRARPPGVMGTNVHSQVAGISTSNALAMLEPPPPEAQPGSRHRPWHKLTEYEMALLRKQMKKNAIWTPSDTMIRRELVKNGRGRENYEKAKALAEMTGEPLVDEDPVDYNKTVLAPGEVRFKPISEKEKDTINRGMKLNEAKKEKKAREKEQAAKDAMELEEASKRIGDAGDMFKNLFNTADLGDSVIVATPSVQKKTPARPVKKRKRASTPVAPVTDNGKLSSSVKGVVADPQPGPKRLKIAIAPAPSSTPATKPPAPRDTKASGKTLTVPLAPAGLETPKVTITRKEKENFSPATSPIDSKKPPIPSAQTAATSRPRRISIAISAANNAVASDPIPTPRSPATLSDRSTRAAANRSRAATGSTKAASAEPPSRRHELRRGSNISLPSAAAPEQPGQRVSGRRRPVPGLVTAEEGGKGKVSVGKRKVAPKKRVGKKNVAGGEEPPLPGPAAPDEQAEEIDPNEPRYCLCGDVSWGTMIACENDAVSGATIFYIVSVNRTLTAGM
ncbi:hypothetical protein LTS18_006409 [Coniosporium uncinatum]|uniref:Uncharacterized protein n=1 Tax=Coniosporium uncinatum TaxID=93489 RepID=A0ACC3DCF7_9PEZI|nr:hypothetical protein LTS18_006409 [Coniosporium uncinatum]